MFDDPRGLFHARLGGIKGLHGTPVVSDQIDIRLGQSIEGQAKDGQKEHKNNGHDHSVPSKGPCAKTKPGPSRIGKTPMQETDRFDTPATLLSLHCSIPEVNRR